MLVVVGVRDQRALEGTACGAGAGESYKKLGAWSEDTMRRCVVWQWADIRERVRTIDPARFLLSVLGRRYTALVMRKYNDSSSGRELLLHA